MTTDPTAAILRALQADAKPSDIRPLMTGLDPIKRRAIADTLVEDAAAGEYDLTAAHQWFIWLDRAEPVALEALGLTEVTP